jgi:LEA14-like dessication related protein
MKNRAVILTVVCVLGFSTCQSLGLESVIREPVFAVSSVDLTAVTFTGVDMIGKIMVNNPNAFSIPFPELNWELFINTNSFIRGTIKNDTVITSKNTTIIDVPINVSYEGIYNSFRSFQNTREAVYVFAIDAKFTLPVLGEKTYHFEVPGELPLVKIPVIDFKGITLKTLTIQRAELELIWEVENQNNFSLTIDEFNFELAVNQSSWGKGNVQNSPVVRGNGKVLIPLTVSLNSLNILREITNITVRRSDFTYTCNGAMGFSGDLPGLRGISLPFNFNGRQPAF